MDGFTRWAELKGNEQTYQSCAESFSGVAR